MRTTQLLVILTIVCSPVHPQSSTHPAVGQGWEAIRTDPAVPAFERGKAFAIEGRFAEAEQEFRKGLSLRRALAQFNMGVLDYERAKYRSAYRHFRTAYRLKQEKAFLDSLRSTRRLAATHPRKR
jgi:TolA-binding protein